MREEEKKEENSLVAYSTPYLDPAQFSKNQVHSKFNTGKRTCLPFYNIIAFYCSHPFRPSGPEMWLQKRVGAARAVKV